MEQLSQDALAATGKVIAVHINYPSRAAQRGRTPEQPSYFLKPSSSLSLSGGTVERPLSIELLPVAAEAEDGWHRVAVSVSDGSTRWLAIFATPTPGAPAGAPRALSSAVTRDGTLTTYARVAALRLSETGDALTLSLVDGQAARWSGDSPVTVRLPASATDLHLDIAAQRRLSRAGELQRLG
jgi:hypothetical protein